MSAVKPVSVRAPARKKSVRRTTAVEVAAKEKAVTVPAPAEEPRKPVKPRLVRDSFTMPQTDFDLVAVLKQRALGFQRPAKKSELLRAGLHALAALDDKRLRAALDALQPLKPGRPKKSA